MTTQDLVKKVLELDCGDNSCRYAKGKGGQRTNGGCRCNHRIAGDAAPRLARIVQKLIEQRDSAMGDFTIRNHKAVLALREENNAELDKLARGEE